MPPCVTVVFLLYNAERTVASLVSGLAAQQRPGVPRQDEWLAALFMDDHSQDGTREALERCLAAEGRPAHWTVVRNEKNLGLAATLNVALSRVTTPYALTCHLDCFFGVDTYVARMVDLAAAHPTAGVITGKPCIPAGTALSFAEKVNLAANLMDILPPETSDELVPVGFAEGRCDIFRVEALRAAGFYDTTLRTAGEDQVLAARMRRAGYQVYQAPHLPYVLSVSGEQDTVGRLLRHQRLFGRAHPYILLRTRNASAGVAGEGAGANRRARLFLRVQQVGSVALGIASLALAVAGARILAGVALLFVLALKAVLFRRHWAAAGIRGLDRLAFLALQPAFDVSYTCGLMQGLLRFASGSPTRPID